MISEMAIYGNVVWLPFANAKQLGETLGIFISKDKEREMTLPHKKLHLIT